VRLALRTQQVIAHEAGVADTADPLAGSYLIENLTDEIERRSMDYIERIDGYGGALAAVEAGFMQAEIQESAYQAQMRIERQEDLVVGVNSYQTEQDSDLEILSVAPEIEVAQREHLVQVRSKRDQGQADKLLERLGKASGGSENLMPILIECVEADVTLGEICGELRASWGEYRPPVGL
jgi:methylmalonyl-CoA mutase N-terminal domain/subunit